MHPFPNAATQDLRDLTAMVSVRYGLRWHTAMHAAFLIKRHPELWISSGRRTRARNKAVGGARNSWHLYGRAADFVGPLSVLRQAEETAWKQRVSPNCTGPEEVLLEKAGARGQHLHVAW